MILKSVSQYHLLMTLRLTTVLWEIGNPCFLVATTSNLPKSNRSFWVGCVCSLLKTKHQCLKQTPYRTPCNCLSFTYLSLSPLHRCKIIMSVDPLDIPSPPGTASICINSTWAWICLVSVNSDLKALEGTTAVCIHEGTMIPVYFACDCQS